jgi:hypothetical protein
MEWVYGEDSGKDPKEKGNRAADVERDGVFVGASHSALSNKNPITLERLGLDDDNIKRVEKGWANQKGGGGLTDHRGKTDPASSSGSEQGGWRPIGEAGTSLRSGMSNPGGGIPMKGRNNVTKKLETKRAQKSDIEKALQSNLEGFVTRSVESVRYSIPASKGRQGKLSKKNSSLNSPNESNFNSACENVLTDASVKLLLQYAAERIVLPHGERTFKHFVLTQLSQQLFRYLFWFSHCQNFHRLDSLDEQESLLKLVSVKYVSLINLVGKSHKDFFFKYFPYALASAICSGFHYLFPGSRHQYKHLFKRQLYLTILQLMTGMRVCPISVHLTRMKLFPDEEVDDQNGEDDPFSNLNNSVDQKKQGDLTSLLNSINKSASTNKIGVVGGETTSPNDKTRNGSGKQLQPSQSAPMLRGHGNSDNWDSLSQLEDEMVTFSPLRQFLLDSDQTLMAATNQPPAIPLPRQLRKPFAAASVSPLVQEYLQNPHPNVGRGGFKLKRTTPVRWCRVGGGETHIKIPDRAGSQEIVTQIAEKIERKKKKPHIHACTHAPVSEDKDKSTEMKHWVSSEHTKWHTQKQPCIDSHIPCWCVEYTKSQKDSIQEMKDHRGHLKSSLSDIEVRRKSVLDGGLSNIGRFCLDLVQSVESRKIGEGKKDDDDK